MTRIASPEKLAVLRTKISIPIKIWNRDITWYHTHKVPRIYTEKHLKELSDYWHLLRSIHAYGLVYFVWYDSQNAMSKTCLGEKVIGHYPYLCRNMETYGGLNCSSCLVPLVHISACITERGCLEFSNSSRHANVCMMVLQWVYFSALWTTTRISYICRQQDNEICSNTRN